MIIGIAAHDPSLQEELELAATAATARVPAAYGASSNTPMGPFQKTVPAVPMTPANRAADSGPMSRPI